MAAGRKIKPNDPMGAIEQAVKAGNYQDARRAMTEKLARMMDNTDSARDAKALAISLDPLIDKCEAFEMQRSDIASTPYAQIMREAEAALANV